MSKTNKSSPIEERLKTYMSSINDIPHAINKNNNKETLCGKIILNKNYSLVGEPILCIECLKILKKKKI